MKDYFNLLRIKQWIKNILIFIPLIFSKMITIDNFITTFIGFIAFCLMASSIYIINDIQDIEKDQHHHLKKKRPLASGKVKKTIAIYIAILMIISSIIINIIINKSIINVSLLFLIVYLLINLLYSFGLKNIVILDIVLLASGFIIRIYYGASLLNIKVSKWLFLTILNASFFMGFGKRKKEILLNTDSRTVLKDYDESFLDKFQYLTLTLTIVFYSLWAIEQNIKYLYLTIPILMIIFMRYCLILEKSEEGDPTTILYSDKYLWILVIIYGISMLLFLTI